MIPSSCADRSSVRLTGGRRFPGRKLIGRSRRVCSRSLKMSPRDLVCLGIADGSAARLTSRVGSVIAPVEPTEPGTRPASLDGLTPGRQSSPKRSWLSPTELAHSHDNLRQLARAADAAFPLPS